MVAGSNIQDSSNVSLSTTVYSVLPCSLLSVLHVQYTCTCTCTCCIIHHVHVYLHDGLSREVIEKLYSHEVLQVAQLVHKVPGGGEIEGERGREREGGGEEISKFPFSTFRHLHPTPPPPTTTCNINYKQDEQQQYVTFNMNVLCHCTNIYMYVG